MSWWGGKKTKQKTFTSIAQLDNLASRLKDTPKNKKVLDHALRVLRRDGEVTLQWDEK